MSLEYKKFFATLWMLMPFFFKDFPKIKSLKNQKKNILVSLKVPYIQCFIQINIKYFINFFLTITIINSKLELGIYK